MGNLAAWGRDWLPVISSTGVFVTAVVAYLAYRQALDAGRRDQWWARAQWAIESALDPAGNRRLPGLVVLTSLKTSKLATPQDAALFDTIARSIQAELAAAGPSAVGPAGVGPAGVPRSETAEPVRAQPDRELLAQAARLLAARAKPAAAPRKPAPSPISGP